MNIIDTNSGAIIDTNNAIIQTICPICGMAVRTQFYEYLDTVACTVDDEEEPEDISILCDTCGKISAAIFDGDIADTERIKLVRSVLTDENAKEIPHV